MPRGNEDGDKLAILRAYMEVVLEINAKGLNRFTAMEAAIEATRLRASRLLKREVSAAEVKRAVRQR